MQKVQTVRDELCRLFAKAKMPTNPALASEILKLSADEKSNVSDFAAVIRNDAALATRLLKTANTVEFAQLAPVTTIERAVTVMGINRVKTTALAFQLVTHLDRLGGVPFDMKMFWQHSLLRACLARSIAKSAVPERVEEAFLVGLLQECGVLLLVQLLGIEYASACQASLSPSAFYAVERASFPHTHVDAVAAMAFEWSLPPIIAVPLKRHHSAIRPKDEQLETDRLSAVGYFVGSLSFANNLKITSDDNQLRDFGVAVLGLDEHAWARVQQQATDEYQRVSPMFENVLPENIGVGDLLSAANTQLAEVASQGDQRVIDVQAEREALERQQERLKDSLCEYSERAAVDPLTNVLNGGAITEAARAAIAQNLDKRVSVGALFLDIDNFKLLNHTHGHSTGDRVLKSVAALLGQEAQQCGPVGRYGGEEFVILVCGQPAESTRQIGERIVKCVRRLDTTALGVPGPITCSIGAVWTDRVPFRSADELFAAASRLMNRAKQSGKDRCCFELRESWSRDIDAPLPSGNEATRTPPSESTGDGNGQPAQMEDMLALAKQLNDNETDAFVGIRKQERKNLVAPCTLHYFTGSGSELGAEAAATRNLSTGGAGLLAARPMLRGEPVEVVLDRGTSILFLAGLVAFCRCVDGAIHDIGVQFVSHSVTPIISGDAAEALKKHDWVDRALSAKLTGKLQCQASG